VDHDRVLAGVLGHQFEGADEVVTGVLEVTHVLAGHERPAPLVVKFAVLVPVVEER